MRKQKFLLLNAKIILLLLPFVSVNIPFGSFYLTPAHLALLSLIAGILIHGFFRSLKGVVQVKRPIFNLLMIVFCFSSVVLLGALLNDTLANGLKTVLTFSTIPIFAALTFRHGSSVWAHTVYLTGLVVGVLLLIRLAGFLPLFEFEKAGNAVEGSLISGITMFVRARGEYGILLILCLLAASICLVERKISVFWFSAVVALMIMAAVVSFSRSTWLSVSLFLLIFLSSRVVLRASALASARNTTMLISALFISAMFSYTVAYSVLDAVIALRAESVLDRLVQYQLAIDWIQQNPVFGGSDQQALDAFGYSVHNAFLMLALAHGVIAVTLIASIVVYLGIGFLAMAFSGAASVIDRRIAVLFLGSLICCIIEMSFYPLYNSLVSCILFGIAWGIYARQSSLVGRRFTHC